MKYIVFGLILICCHVWANNINYHDYMKLKQSSQFREFLERCKSIVKDGDKSLGIPKLEPYITNELPITINDGELNSLLNNIRIWNLSRYNVIDGSLELSNMKISMNLSWPSISMISSYTRTKTNDAFFYGTGDMYIFAKDFAVDTEIAFVRDDEHLKVKDIKSNFSTKKIDFIITGYLNNEQLSEAVSKFVTKIIPALLEQNMFVDSLNNIITEILNTFLSTKTIKEVTNLLGINYY